MLLLHSLPENATLLDLRKMYADPLEKLRPYGYARPLVSYQTLLHR